MNYYELETASRELVQERLDRARREHLAQVAGPKAGRLRLARTTLGCALVNALVRRDRRGALGLR